MTDRSLTTGKEVGLFPRPYKFRFIYQLPPLPSSLAGYPVKLWVVIDEQEICPQNELHVGWK